MIVYDYFDKDHFSYVIIQTIVTFITFW